MTVSEIRHPSAQGEHFKMSCAGSISDVGGGKCCGLCIPSWAVCTGNELCNTALFPFCLFGPTLPHSLQAFMSRGLKCSPHFHWPPDYCSRFHDSQKGKHSSVGKSNAVLEMRCKSSQQRKGVFMVQVYILLCSALK